MNQILLSIFLSPALNYIPEIFFGLLILFAGIRYYARLRRGDLEGIKTSRFFGKLILVAIGFKTLYAALLTWGQYVIWKSSTLASALLSEAVVKDKAGIAGAFPKLFDEKGGYFLYYSLSHFWLEFGITLVLGLAFYLLLMSFQKKNPRFLTLADARLGLLGGITAGWPGFVVYLFGFALIFLLYGLVRKLVLKEEYTPITEPLFIAAFLAAAFGFWIINFLGLSALRI